MKDVDAQVFKFKSRRVSKVRNISVVRGSAFTALTQAPNLPSLAVLSVRVDAARSHTFPARKVASHFDSARGLGLCRPAALLRRSAARRSPGGCGAGTPVCAVACITRTLTKAQQVIGHTDAP